MLGRYGCYFFFGFILFSTWVCGGAEEYGGAGGSEGERTAGATGREGLGVPLFLNSMFSGNRT